MDDTRDDDIQPEFVDSDAEIARAEWQRPAVRRLSTGAAEYNPAGFNNDGIYGS